MYDKSFCSVNQLQACNLLVFGLQMVSSRTLHSFVCCSKDLVKIKKYFVQSSEMIKGYLIKATSSLLICKFSKCGKHYTNKIAVFESVRHP